MGHERRSGEDEVGNPFYSLAHLIPWHILSSSIAGRAISGGPKEMRMSTWEVIVLGEDSLPKYPRTGKRMICPMLETSHR